jgi:microcin C transport system substrate-binding protein
MFLGYYGLLKTTALANTALKISLECSFTPSVNSASSLIFALAFMRSKHIVAPWYNNHYTEQIRELVKYDDYTIAITGATARPANDLFFYYGIAPLPKHAITLDKHWVRNDNWRIIPTVSPYQISKIKKGRYVEFSLQDNWWGQDKRYLRHRYNVNKVRVVLIRDINVAYTYFTKARLDVFSLKLSMLWHGKARGAIYDKGYVDKIWFYNDTPQPSFGLYLNTEHTILANQDVRYGIAYALNIDKMLTGVLRGDYNRLHSNSEGYGDYTNPAIKARPFSLTQADYYFDRAGWQVRGSDGIRVKDGQRLSLTVLYGDAEDTEQLVLLKEEAKKAGLELVLKKMDGSTFFKSVLEKKHDIAWMGWTFNLRPVYWQGYHSANAGKPQTNNITNTRDKELDRLIIAYRAESDEAKRIKLAHQIQQRIHDLAVYIPTKSAPYARAAYWRWVKLPEVPGTKMSYSLFSPFDSTYGGLFWLDLEEKQATLAARKAGKTFSPVFIKDTRFKLKNKGAN